MMALLIFNLKLWLDTSGRQTISLVVVFIDFRGKVQYSLKFNSFWYVIIDTNWFNCFGEPGTKYKNYYKTHHILKRIKQLCLLLNLCFVKTVALIGTKWSPILSSRCPCNFSSVSITVVLFCDTNAASRLILKAFLFFETTNPNYADGLTQDVEFSRFTNT